ncbi:MAG: hypothetical protein RQ875_14760 [Vicingaceae bacterium]|nr:hypothetical protein [Vicingaceae bacterium]
MKFDSNSQAGQEKHFLAQLKKVYEAFKTRPMTMKEADVYTGVMRESICRYVATLLEQGKIAVRRKRKCNVTGYPYVNEYTGNPDLFPKSNQFKMF